MSKATYIGKFDKGTFPTESRTLQRSDNRTLDVEIVGLYSAMERIVKQKGPGDDASELVAQTELDDFSKYRVRTLSLSRSSGDIGTLRATLVYVKDPKKPYHITYSVDMQEDSRALLTHPRFRRNNDCMQYIRKWNDTAEGKRVKWGKTREEDEFYYFDPDESSTAPDDYKYKKIEDADAKRYCRAVLAGIERYNVYLPVVTKTSLYLKHPPGAKQDEETHELDGTITFSDTIGKWDHDFDFELEGYEDTEKQGWFKTKDSYSQNSDGTWQRSEEWVFSDSKTHKWIYDEVK